MAKGKAKGKTKKDVKKAPAQAQKAPEDKTTLGDIIKDSDSAVVVTVTKGQIEVTGIKNINFAYEAKGLLIGAMDTYNTRPVINGLNNNTRAILSHLQNINQKVDGLLPVPEAKEIK